MRVNPILGLLAAPAAAQLFVPAPKHDETVSSSVLEDAEISYKKTSICETTEGVTPYSGYVTIPSRHLEDAALWSDSQSAHIFFWYFPARKDASSAPTAIYLAGGPGTSSLDAMSDFPCWVNPDSNTTTLNPHSWNNNVNMLYIDQPVGTGFSYVDLANGTFDSLTYAFTVVDDEDDMPELNVTTRQATFNRASAMDMSDEKAMATVPRTTMGSARTLWKFAQVWFQEFPERNTDNEEISVWSSSYGGYYGPAVMAYFSKQNDLIADGKHNLSTAKELDLATLGLLEPALDTRYLAPAYPDFSLNNTYGIEVYSEEVYTETMEYVNDPEQGCLVLLDKCRALVAEGDPQSFGNNETVNEGCMNATNVCYNKVQTAQQTHSWRQPFDITQFNVTAWPPFYKTGFFNQPWVQEDLGVPLNFTATIQAITGAFFSVTGDAMIHDLSDIEKCLDAGLNVAMVFGDRDGRVPWIGGEDASLDLEFDGAKTFRDTGYASIFTNSSYDGGFVRQGGGLSFSRIFQAGHGVGGYQPETMSKVFDRVMSRRDVATGDVKLQENKDYTSEGPMNIRNEMNDIPEANINACHVLNAAETCTEKQMMALSDGSAVVKDWLVVEPKGENGDFGPSNTGGSENDGQGGNNGGGNDEGDGEEKPANSPSGAVKNGAFMTSVVLVVMVVLMMDF